MSKQDWIWMGHPGHLCIAHWCRFHMNTYVNGYIISTVGEHFPPADVRRIYLTSRQNFPHLGDDRKRLSKEEYESACQLQGDAFDQWYLQKFGFEEIGLNRLYESMVFKAEKSDLTCCPWTICGDDVDMEGYMTVDGAFKGHYDLCEKWDAEQTPEGSPSLITSICQAIKENASQTD